MPRVPREHAARTDAPAPAFAASVAGVYLRRRKPRKEPGALWLDDHRRVSRVGGAPRSRTLASTRSSRTRRPGVLAAVFPRRPTMPGTFQGTATTRMGTPAPGSERGRS